MPIRLRGARGEVRYGYHVVARVDGWTLEDDVCRGTASAVNAFWLETGGPFALVLEMGAKQWVWMDAQIQSVVGEAVVRVTGSPYMR